jgi:hypothetical protein
MDLEQIFDKQFFTSKYETVEKAAPSKEASFVTEELRGEPLSLFTSRRTTRRMLIEERTTIALKAELQSPKIDLKWFAEDGFVSMSQSA